MVIPSITYVRSLSWKSEKQLKRQTLKRMENELGFSQKCQEGSAFLYTVKIVSFKDTNTTIKKPSSYTSMIPNMVPAAEL